MSYITKEVPWATWQFGVFKLSMIALGIIVGASFPDFWKPYLWPLGLFFVITAIWITVIWLKAIGRSSY